MRTLVFRLILFLLLAGIISCGSFQREEPGPPALTETELSAPVISEDAGAGNDSLSFLKALAPSVELENGKAWRRFDGDTACYRIIPDSLFRLDGNGTLVLFRCIPGEEPCSHAEAAYFQLVEYNEEGGSLKVLQESALLPVYSPWCDKLDPRKITIRGVPHLLFEMSDGHQESSREQYWMISLGEKNFGTLVWEEEVYTAGLTEGDRNKIGVFPVEEMEAEVEFDTTRCDEGVWVMKLSKTITKSLSNASEGEPSPESRKAVDDFGAVVKKQQLKKVYRMNRQGRLVKLR